MSKVYLVEPYTKFNLRTAEAFGELTYLSPNRLDPFDPGNAVYHILVGLKNFNPEEDYLCITGNVVAVAYMVAVALEKFKTLNILVFDATNSNYRERVLSC